MTLAGFFRLSTTSLIHFSCGTHSDVEVKVTGKLLYWIKMLCIVHLFKSAAVNRTRNREKQCTYLHWECLQFQFKTSTIISPLLTVVVFASPKRRIWLLCRIFIWWCIINICIYIWCPFTGYVILTNIMLSGQFSISHNKKRGDSEAHVNFSFYQRNSLWGLWLLAMTFWTCVMKQPLSGETGQRATWLEMIVFITAKSHHPSYQSELGQIFNLALTYKLRKRQYHKFSFCDCTDINTFKCGQ